MALPPSTANWHWKSKQVLPWARQWFQQELVALSVKGDGTEEVRIEEVTEVEGDVELGQRKSKLITIFDCRLELKWSGTTADGTEVKGKLSIPEVSHETTVDKTSDYEFKWSLETASSPAVTSVFKLAKSGLQTALETQLALFPVALVDTHGKDLTVSGDNSADPSRVGTPAPTVGSGSSTAPVAPKAATAPKPSAPAKALNTSTVRVEATFMASPADLFSLLTDEKRIPQWSHAPALSSPQPGSSYSLFGGGVTGTYKSLNPSTEIVQSFVLQSPQWPSGHAGTLTTTLSPNSDSTTVTWSLAGVPTGLQDETERNIEGYYVNGLKSIGLGAVL